MKPTPRPRVRSAPSPSGVGARLSLALERLHLSNADLAARTKDRGEAVSVDAIRKLRTGRDQRVEVGTVRRLAAALGCSAGWLAFAEGEAPAAMPGPTGDA